MTWMWIACTPGHMLDDPFPPDEPGASATGEAPTGTAATGTDTATGPTAETGMTTPVPPPLRVLLFTKTEGFRHGSIDDAVPALEAQGASRRWAVTHTETASIFTAQGLADFDVIVFLLTTGDVLDDDQQAAMEAFVGGGGGFAGVHSATDTEYDWDWYGQLVGAYFDGHPAVQDAELTVDDADHPSTAHLDPRFERRDEWYAFDPNPRPVVNVLLSLDEATYDPGSHDMEGDHPIAWSQEIFGGRSFYSGGGHTSASYADEGFLLHLAEGIAWAAGRGPT